jgi:hypothetical protein
VCLQYRLDRLELVLERPSRSDALTFPTREEEGFREQNEPSLRPPQWASRLDRGVIARTAAERDHPRVLSTIEVDRGYAAVWRLEQRQTPRADQRIASSDVTNVRGFRIRLLERVEDRVRHGRHIKRSRLRVERRASPACTADPARHRDGAFLAWRREQGPIVVLLEDCERFLAQLRCEID